MLVILIIRTTAAYYI